MKNPISLIFITAFLAVSFQDASSQNIFMAVMAGNKDSVRVMVEKDPSLVNLRNQGQVTPLHYAAGSGNKEMISLLIEKGAAVDARDDEGRTPLDFVVFLSGNVELAKLFIEKGADINNIDNSGRSLVVWAVIRGHKDLVNYFIESGARLPSPGDPSGKDLLFRAASGGMIKLIDMMIAGGADILGKDEEGNSLLHLAALGGSADLTRILLKAGIKADEVNIFGWTALHYSAVGGDRETASVLLDSCAGKDVVNTDGMTAFNLATELGNRDVAELLRSSGATQEPPRWPKYKGLYFGLTPPGKTPEKFAPGIISRANLGEYACSFSTDGSEFYYTRGTRIQRIMMTHMVNGEWTAPVTAKFSEGWSAHEPHVTADNQRIYWGWFRPVPEGEKSMMGNYGIWFSVRNAGGWSEAKYAGQGMFVSSDREGKMYITQDNLAEVTAVNGRFTAYAPLKGMDNVKGGAHPCIAPDGSYIVFDVEGGNHLFVAFNNGDGTWSNATDLAEHGIQKQGGIASISPDGKYLFYGCQGDIYWVSTDLIKELKPSK